MKLPTLFKKTSTGAIAEWTIESDGAVIRTVHGQVGGKLQATEDVIKAGKNEGRVNATTVEEQAAAEAQSKHTKQLKKGYVTSIEAARAGEVDAVIEGGILPMLAFPFEKQGHKLTYPLYAQCKLDGTRCIAIIANGKCELYSRTRKPITSMPHIVAALEEAFPDTDIVLDGELYAAHLNEDFEQIIHFVRQQEAAEGHEAIQYWVYDLPGPGTFEERYDRLVSILPKSPHLVLVEATLLTSEAETNAYFASALQQGFEGAMLRNCNGLYVNKRSSDLIKLKTMQDAEFKIIGMEEGRGKLTGHVGAFVCVTEAGGEFRAKLKGATATLKTYFENPSTAIGKLLTVKYQNLSADGLPRFPIGVAVRDYE